MDILEKLDMFSNESRVYGEEPTGMRPIQFMKWFGKFRPGDRVDAYFGEDYINFAGTNANGDFAGVSKESDIDDPDEVLAFKAEEGNIWNFV